MNRTKNDRDISEILKNSLPLFLMFRNTRHLGVFPFRFLSPCINNSFWNMLHSFIENWVGNLLEKESSESDKKWRSSSSYTEGDIIYAPPVTLTRCFMAIVPTYSRKCTITTDNDDDHSKVNDYRVRSNYPKKTALSIDHRHKSN